jgi:HD-GYP domain-containing protein (c-di-GMP phosphodiesterase class II)
MIPGTKRNVSSIVEITDLVETEERIRQSFVELAETTSRALGVRDPYTQRHEQRVGELAREVGRRMGLSEEELLGLYLGGTLHDIGKIAIPETILTKPGELKEVEWQMIKSHPEVGYNQILEDTDFPWPVAEMTLHHHERLDGSGYPDGLKGDELTTEVRILGAVDVVEAMSTRRPYRSARSKGETLEEIRNGKENKYDPEVVEILIQMIEEGEIQFGGK